MRLINIFSNVDYLRLLIEAAISKESPSYGVLLTISIKAVIGGVDEFLGIILTSIAKPVS